MATARHVAMLCILAVAVAGLSGCFGAEKARAGHLRLGYFPNLTHAQALYGLETGLFEDRLAEDGITLEATDFIAGPTAIEALLTGQIDITYVGPSPTVNGILVAGPDKFRIIAGAASGGARFIVQEDVDIAGDEDLEGMRFATPGLGNTQDVALKSYLADHNQTTTDKGGEVQVINAANSDILTLFLTGQVDGAWVPEPWATRLEEEADGVELLDERDLWPGGEFVTTHVVTTAAFLRDHPATVEAFLRAHVEATATVQAGGAEVRQAINDRIERDAGKALPSALLATALAQITFTDDPLVDTFVDGASRARELHLTRADLPPAGTVYDLASLNVVLAQAGEEPIEDP